MKYQYHIFDNLNDLDIVKEINLARGKNEIFSLFFIESKILENPGKYPILSLLYYDCARRHKRATTYISYFLTRNPELYKERATTHKKRYRSYTWIGGDYGKN